MISEKELLREIEDCESKQPTYPLCEKLATLYIIYDHLYGAKKPEINPLNFKYSFDSGPQRPKVEQTPEKKNILPAYHLYVESKKDYQYGNVSIEKVLKNFEMLSQEIKDFIKILYRNTDTPEEREILNTLINEINVGNI